MVNILCEYNPVHRTRLGKDMAVIKWAYDRVLKPILTAAKAKGDMEMLRTAYHTLEKGKWASHHLRMKRWCRRSFSSRFLLNEVLNNKKTITPQSTDAEVAGGFNRIL